MCRQNVRLNFLASILILLFTSGCDGFQKQEAALEQPARQFTVTDHRGNSGQQKANSSTIISSSSLPVPSFDVTLSGSVEANGQGSVQYALSSYAAVGRGVADDFYVWKDRAKSKNGHGKTTGFSQNTKMIMTGVMNAYTGASSGTGGGGDGPPLERADRKGQSTHEMSTTQVVAHFRSQGYKVEQSQPNSLQVAVDDMIITYDLRSRHPTRVTIKASGGLAERSYDLGPSGSYAEAFGIAVSEN